MNYIECQYCEGQGYFTDREEISPWEYTEERTPCPDCNVTGAILAKSGRGYFEEEQPEQIEREEQEHAHI